MPKRLRAQITMDFEFDDYGMKVKHWSHAHQSKCRTTLAANY